MPDKKDKLILDIFEQSFKILANMCKNDIKSNKKLLYGHIKFFMRFMKYREVG